MALIQFDLDDLYTEALDYVAAANTRSRRAYMTDYIESSLDAVPGLMEMIRQRRMSGMKVEPNMSVPEYKSAITPKIEERMKRYRFRYLDGSAPIEGIGEAAGDAIARATGRKWTAEEYIDVFMTPEMIGYVD